MPCFKGATWTFDVEVDPKSSLRCAYLSFHSTLDVGRSMFDVQVFLHSLIRSLHCVALIRSLHCVALIWMLLFIRRRSLRYLDVGASKSPYTRLSGRSPFSLRGALKIATFRVQGLFKKNSDPMARIICNGPYTHRGHLLGKEQSAKHGYAWPGNIRH